MLCMDHQHHVQQMRFFLCVVCVRPDHTQEILRSGQLGHGEMDVQRVAMEIMALHSVGIGNDRREAADELDRLQKQVLDGGAVRIRIVGIQAQHAARQLVHHVAAGVTHDHALGKAVRQLARLTHDAVEAGKLILRGQIAHKQQIRYLLEAESAGLAVRLDNIVQLDAAIIQPPGGGHSLAVLQQVALYAADLGDADQHAGTVAVTQAFFDLAVIKLVANGIFLLNSVAQRLRVTFQNIGILFSHDAFLSLRSACGSLDLMV